MKCIQPWDFSMNNRGVSQEKKVESMESIKLKNQEAKLARDREHPLFPPAAQSLGTEPMGLVRGPGNRTICPGGKLGMAGPFDHDDKK
jgi:hypothetical protein